jgi:histone H3/H4
MVERILPLAAVDRIIRKGGASRVSEDAAVALAEILEEYGVKVSQQAAEFAKHANRKTVVGADVKLAVKNTD